MRLPSLAHSDEKPLGGEGGVRLGFETRIGGGNRDLKDLTLTGGHSWVYAVKERRAKEKLGN